MRTRIYHVNADSDMKGTAVSQLLTWEHHQTQILGSPRLPIESGRETVYDVHTRDRLLSLWWSRLCLLDSNLLPWPCNAKMTDINPNILNDKHSFHQCYPSFWSHGFGLTASRNRRQQEVSIQTFCAEHNQMEQTNIDCALAT